MKKVHKKIYAIYIIAFISICTLIMFENYTVVRVNNNYIPVRRGMCLSDINVGEFNHEVLLDVCGDKIAEAPFGCSVNGKTLNAKEITDYTIQHRCDLSIYEGETRTEDYDSKEMRMRPGLDFVGNVYGSFSGISYFKQLGRIGIANVEVGKISNKVQVVDWIEKPVNYILKTDRVVPDNGEKSHCSYI